MQSDGEKRKSGNTVEEAGDILIELRVKPDSLRNIRRDLIKYIAEIAVERLKEKLRAKADDA